MPRLSMLWDYRNEPVVALLSTAAVVLIAFLICVSTWQYFVRVTPFKCNDVWLPASVELCSDATAAQSNSAPPPIGAILPFFGSDEDLPGNWVVCDGRDVPQDSLISIDANAEEGGNQLPDLRSRFIRGAATQLADEGIVIGGTDTINLSHSHLWAEKRGTQWWSYESGEFQRVDDWDNGIGDDGEGNRPLSNDASLNLFTDSQGDTNADNRPAFVELRYIIRVR